MSRKRITQALVDSLLAKVPDVVEENVWDNLLPGFGIRRGRSWQAMRRIGGRSVRMHGLPTLREEPSVKVTRSRVSKWLADPDVKDEPAKTTEPLTVHRLIERYLRERPKVNGDDRPLAPEYLNEIARCLAFDVSSKIGHMQVSTVTSKTIKGLINGIAKPKHARHVLAYVRKMFNWAVEQEIVERSPAAGIKPPAGQKACATAP